MEEPDFVVIFAEIEYEVYLSRCILRLITSAGSLKEETIFESNSLLCLQGGIGAGILVEPFQTAYQDYIVEKYLLGDGNEQ